MGDHFSYLDLVVYLKDFADLCARHKILCMGSVCALVH